jgi:outer membrane receptor protein involved in Fe transport
MQAPSKLSMTPVAAAVTAALYPGAAVMAQDDGVDTVLDEIIVTSRKRSESVQEIPATIQAISQESLAAMGAKGMEDYARFVPSVNLITYGPGSSTMVFRGAITGAGYIGQSTSSVYLDEISVTQTGAQPSIRAVDIARVEALSGPQGTLYGSDAQAGTMRILTNQPVMNSFEAVFDGELRGGTQSDESFRGSLVFNLPLIEDKLALRVAAYNDHDGGFIDNVFGRTPDSYGLDGDNKAPSGWGSLDNRLSVKDRWNDADVSGGRIHLLWEMNDSWATTFSYHHQTSDSGAGNYYDPFVGDLQVVRFHQEERNEVFEMGSIKVEGDLGFAQLVAAASYYDRNTKGLTDITTYAHYWAAGYCHDTYYMAGDPFLDDQGVPTGYYANYYWSNPDTGYILWYPRYCQGETVEGDFFSSYDTRKAPTNDDKMTVELRLSSQGDTFDWIVGGYYEESKDSWVADFATPTLGGDGLTNMFQQSAAARYWEFYFSQYYGTPVTYPNVTASWFSQSHTDWEQSAIFGEATWHINDALDLTIGGRYFERSNTNFYLVNHPGGVAADGQAPWGEPDTAVNATRLARIANNGLPAGRKGSESQSIPKISLKYSLSDDSIVYGLYTRGLRQGGVNRSRGAPFFPNSYDSDIMDNYEMGYKSTFAEGRGRLNVTAYNMKWSDYQPNMVDPASQQCLDANGDEDPSLSIDRVCGQPWQAIIANAGEAHINGLQTELDYVINDNWLLGFNYEVMEAETDTSADLNGDGENNLVADMRLPLVPSSKASFWVEYSQPTDLLGADLLFVRTQWSHTGDSLNILEALPDSDPNPQTVNPSYTIGDIRLGIVGEDWQIDLFVNNLTDERAIYTNNTGQFEWGAAQLAEGRAHHQTLYTARPREVGVRYMKRWGD